MIYAFLGKENALKEEALEELKKQALDGASADLNCTVFYPEQLEPHQFQDAVNTQPFLSPKRFVVVRDFDRILQPVKDSISNYLKDPSKNTVLVLTADLSEKETRSRKEDFFSMVLECATVRDFAPLQGVMLSRYLKENISSNKKTVDEQTISLLVEKLGNDLGKLRRAIDNLVTYVGERQKIEKTDVEALVGRSLEESVFDLTKAVCRRQTARSLTILSGLFKESVSTESVVGAIGAEFRKILKIKGLLEAGESQWRIQSEVRLSQQAISELTDIARRMEPDAVKRCLETILKADQDCKNRNLDKNEKWVVMESLVVKLSEFSELA